jgi:predicted DsbA family dithiol-disulfide isomerase
MKIDIWSDIVCPFCYIGKRHLEQALEQSGLTDSVEIEWHSFELDPTAVTRPEASIYEELGRRKGWSLEQSKQIHNQMEERARLAGLDYDFSKTIPANSRRAHRLLHLAKENGVQDAVKEQLLHGYFTEGKNIDDTNYLVEVGLHHGMTKDAVLVAIESPEMDKEVDADIDVARRLGIQGVPFFVIDMKYGISGAQPVEAFVEMFKEVAQQ